MNTPRKNPLNAPALSPPSPLPQGGQPIALALSPSSPPPQDGQPSDAPGLSPSSSTLLLCPSDSTLSICHLNSQSAVKTDKNPWDPKSDFIWGGVLLKHDIRKRPGRRSPKSNIHSAKFRTGPGHQLGVLQRRLQQGKHAKMTIKPGWHVSVLQRRLQQEEYAKMIARPGWQFSVLQRRLQQEEYAKMPIRPGWQFSVLQR
ncbi:hypothetical protein ACOMHN_062154 [Nucella lapillus]